MAESDIIKVQIETAIRNVSWATVEVGMKSRHTITIDPVKKTIVDAVVTGKTNFLWMEFSSIRNTFNVTKKVFETGCVKFSVKGETATAVGVIPNINYAFDIILYPAKKLITISGGHDGYPSYNVAVNSKSVYDCVQGFLPELYGDSDVTVKKTNLAW
jgi:hypothetical protein